MSFTMRERGVGGERDRTTWEKREGRDEGFLAGGRRRPQSRSSEKPETIGKGTYG